MDFGPLFPGMVNTVGALLPAMISIGIVVARRARSGLGMADQFWLVVFSLALSAVLARVTVTPDETYCIVPIRRCLYYLSGGHSIFPVYQLDLCNQPARGFFLANSTGPSSILSALVGAVMVKH
jgi:hypothetical protein